MEARGKEMKYIYLHPLPNRIWHWINAILVLVLTVTGLQLRFPEVVILKYGQAILLHKAVGFATAGSFMYWLTYCLFAGGLKRDYAIRARDLLGMFKQMHFYVFLFFKGSEDPFTPSGAGRFNPLQKLAYLSVMLFLTPIIIVTGILLGNILYFIKAIELMGGLRIVDALHVATGYLFVLYIIVHLYMTTLGYRVLSHVKAMITGYGEEED
jgi:thiosulfate reductase cytochrome b subunit